MDRLAQEGLAVKQLRRLLTLAVVASTFTGCETEVTEDCSSLSAEDCGWEDNSCALTAEHGCRNVCRTDDDCMEDLICRPVAGRKHPRTGEDVNPGPRVVCIPP